MATITRVHAPSNFLDRIQAIITNAQDAHARHRVYRNTLNELRQLSHRDLADLGLHKSTLKSVAYEAAYNK